MSTMVGLLGAVTAVPLVHRDDRWRRTFHVGELLVQPPPLRDVVRRHARELLRLLGIGQAQHTEAAIRQGGPFRYANDGGVFGNRERLLPAQPRGYYREYTVKTPGVRDRGARRIVCGGSQPTRPQSCYYTADHYASFARIVQ